MKFVERRAMYNKPSPCSPLQDWPTHAEAAATVDHTALQHH